VVCRNCASLSLACRIKLDGGDWVLQLAAMRTEKANTTTWQHRMISLFIARSTSLTRGEGATAPLSPTYAALSSGLERSGLRHGTASVGILRRISRFAAQRTRGRAGAVAGEHRMKCCIGLSDALSLAPMFDSTDMLSLSS